MRNFLSSPTSAGLSVGIQYFGRAQCSEYCNAATYVQPEVPLATLPGNAQSMMTSLDRHSPSTETPTNAALTGAIQYARSYKTAHPTETVAVLLVTDGVPEAPCSSLSSCSSNPPSLQATVEAASQGANGAPPIKTFVLGIGPSLAAIDQIAAAGGTGQAFLVASSPDALQALERIRSTTVGCAFLVPQPPHMDFSLVNLRYTLPGAPPEVVFYVGDAARCDAVRGGWYYDDPARPTRVLLCPATCDRVHTNGASLDLVLGCPSIIPSP